MTNQPKKTLMRGAAWTVGTRTVIKVLGFVNTVIMARILLPEDYGIVAMGMLIVGMIQTFLDFGATVALLRKDKVSNEEVNSAWTLRFLQGLAAGLVLVAIAPIAVSFFEEPRLRYVIWTFAASVLVASASSMGTTLAAKAFDFALGFKVEATSKLISVAATLVFGLWLGDYRALACGIVAGYLAPLILGYIWHPYRPQWDTSKIYEIWAVTKWLLLANIGNFILRKGDEVIAGRVGSTHEYGLYNVGADLGQLPVQEVGPAMMRALLPVLSTLDAEPRRTNNAVVKATAAINTVIWPIGMGFAALSTQATNLLLGPHWAEAAQFVYVFALVAVLQTVTSPARTLLTLRGYTREQNKLVWVEFAVFAICAALLVPQLHLLGLALSRVIASGINVFNVLISARRYCRLPLVQTLLQIVRPMTGAAIMAMTVSFSTRLVDNNVAQVCIGVTVGVAAYSLWCLISWQLAGRPEGLESTVLELLAARDTTAG